MGTQEDAYASLVGVEAAGPQCNGTGTRVVAGDPAGSILFQKISETDPECGARMPLGRTPLNAGQLDVFRRWIAAGAPND